MHDSTIFTIVKKYCTTIQKWLKGEQLQKNEKNQNKERHARGHEIY